MDVRVRELGPTERAVHGQWYHTAVRVLAGILRIRENYDDLAELVVPAIRGGEAQGQVELLLELGLLGRDGDGELMLADRHITAEDKGDAAVQREWAMTMLDLAKQAAYRFAEDDREMSGEAVAVSQKGYERIGEAMAACRREVQGIAEANSHLDQVMQVSFQVFPLEARGTR